MLIHWYCQAINLKKEKKNVYGPFFALVLLLCAMEDIKIISLKT